MKKQKLLLVGAGTMGSLHARVISESTKFELIGIVDSRQESGEFAASKYETRWFPEIPELDAIDAVVVATPTEAHFEICKDVIESGTALLVEKPVTDSLIKTEELLETARYKQIPMMCGLLERFNPAVLTAMALINEPQLVTARRHSPYAPRILTGVAWDLLIHDVDLALRVFGESPSQTQGSLSFVHPSSHATSEDNAEATLSFSNDRLAQISASRISQRKIREFSIYELDRLIEVDLLRRDVTVYKHVSDQPADTEGRGYRQQTVIEIPELITGVEPLAAQLSHFSEIITGKIDFQNEIDSLIGPHRTVSQLKEQQS